MIHDERRKSGNWFNQLAETLQDGFAVQDRNGILIYANKRLCDLLGYTQDEIQGRHWCEFFCEAKCAPMDQRIVKQKDSEHSAHKIARTAKDGHRICAFISSIPILDRRGSYQNKLSVVIDVTGRKKAERALKESEMRYNILTENSLTGIYIISDGRIVYANSNFARIFGYPEKDTIGLEFGKLSPPGERLLSDERYGMILNDKTAVRHQIARGRKKDGTIVWLKTSDTYIDYQGKPAVLGQVVDVSQENQLGNFLWKSETEQRILSAQLLRNQENERKRLASLLHDDIGQSLSAIKLCLENFDRLSAQAGDQLPGNLLTLANITPLLQETIDEVRRISMDLHPSTLEDLGIIATINWFLRKFQTVHPDIRVESRIDLAENDIPSRYKTPIFRIMQEAFNNIAKHAKANVVQFELKQRDDRIELEIRDNGLGFELSKILTQNPLQRGLGLASMKERCESAGGFFTVVSSLGAGTVLLASWRGLRSQSRNGQPASLS